MRAPSHDRYPSLDGLRGAAALLVFIAHIAHLRRALSLGSAAVDLFFVLSGFVLALPYVADGASPLRAGPFLIRRIFRLYPAYWGALVLSLLLRHGHDPALLSGLSDWIRDFWRQPLHLGDLAAHLLLIGPHFDTDLVNPVCWSLIIELRCSLLVVPLLWGMQWLHGRRYEHAVTLAALGAAVLACLVHSHGGMVTYLPIFLAGAVAARCRRACLLRVAAWPRATSVAAALLGLTLFASRFVPPRYLDRRLADLLIAAGSLLLLLLIAARPRPRAAFETPLASWLGRLSYPLYLLHMPVILVIASRLAPWGIAAIGGAALPVTLILALFFHLYIELPFQDWGRALAARLATGRAQLANAR